MFHAQRFMCDSAVTILRSAGVTTVTSVFSWHALQILSCVSTSTEFGISRYEVYPLYQ